MRTTLNLEPDVLAAARKLASARAVSLGKAVSDLIRRGLDTGASAGSPKGAGRAFPVFEVARGAPPLTLEDVKRDEDEA
jgi:hypothetical protein